ncbi:MAG TPA: hypothetical protein VGO47_10250 [Chlamydiales bacterium]|nr:hypothetical protein [Chlamydiales bacterium]
MVKKIPINFPQYLSQTGGNKTTDMVAISIIVITVIVLVFVIYGEVMMAKDDVNKD